jgi:acyl carrier protein
MATINRYPDTERRLDAFLKRNPMYHAQLAVLLGVHVKTINNWGNGTSQMTVRDRLALRYIELELKVVEAKESPFPLFTTQEAEIAAMIVEHFGVEAHQVTRTASFADDLGADSLDMVELVMAAEEHFGIEITDDEGEAMDTVEKAFDLIAAKKS